MSEKLEIHVTRKKLTRGKGCIFCSFGSKAHWGYVNPQVRHHEEKDGVLLREKTLSEKSYTEENAVNCSHYFHAKHPYLKGY